MSHLRGLYAITDNTLLADGRLLPWCEAALKGGVRILQYRDKANTPEQRLAEATALRDLCQQYDARLLINDDMHLAAKLGVDVHLGQGDGSLREARELLGPDAIVGATCLTDVEYAKYAEGEGASYVAFGRFFNSKTKPGVPAADTDLLERARAAQSLPIVAIGGITLDRAASLIAHGASLIAVVNDLFAHDTPEAVEARARAFTQVFDAH